MSEQVAFLGLGVMGFPMAGHLASAGHRVTVYNRTRSVAQRWAETHTGQVADTPAEAVATADVVMVCVGNDDDVRSVVLGDDGALSGMRAGSTLVDHTTASATLAEELASACAEQGVAFLDAPVSGGEAGAVNGALAIMLGGAPDHFTRVEPVLNVYAKAAQLIGPVGHGQKAKMVNQICIAGLLQGLSEALQFADTSGLDTDKVLAVISNGAAQSWQMENRAKTMIAREFDFGFAVDWMRKDLGIALEAAKQLGVELPVTQLVDQYYADVQANGGSRWDTSSLIARYEKP